MTRGCTECSGEAEVKFHGLWVCRECARKLADEEYSFTHDIEGFFGIEEED